VKPEPCKRCRFDGECPGLRGDYVERFGDAVYPITSS
jgi:hypothetical protein